MKRFVESQWAIVLTTTTLTLVVSALTNANEDGTLLIAIGILAGFICSQSVLERLHESRAKHSASSTHRRIPR
jgi:Na+/melibiose symporter-like transporter